VATDLTQDEVIDLISLYMTDVVGMSGGVDGEIEEAHLDGVVTGLAIAVAIAGGCTGPLSGEDMARVGAELAGAVISRIVSERKISGFE